MFLLFLLFVLVVLGLIFIPKFFRKTKEEFSKFQMTSLEKSILRDLKRERTNLPDEYILYLFSLKPIREELKREIAADIIDMFPEDSSEHSYLLSLLTPPRVDPIPPVSKAKRRVQLIDAFEQMTRMRPNSTERQNNNLPKQEQKEAGAPPTPSVSISPQITVRQIVVNPFEEIRQEILDIVDFLDGEGDAEIIFQIGALNQFEIQNERRRARHFYESKENVHALGADCMNKAYSLVQRYIETYSRENLEREISLLLLNAPLGKMESISATLDRVQEDDSLYGIDENIFTLAQLFYAVSCLIKETPEEQQTEMVKRLYEELEEASDKCGTGHIVRFMNVLQGFGTEFDLKLPLKDEIYARLSILIQREIEQSGGDQMDEILERHETLVNFMKEKQHEFTDKIMEEYKDVGTEEEIRAHIKESLNRYSKTTEF